MAAFSLDLRERIVAAVDAGDSSLAAVATRFAVSLGLVKKLLAQRRALGHVESLGHGGGQPLRADLEALTLAVAEDPDVSLAELRAQVPALDGGRLSLGAISHWLKVLGLPRKKRLSGQPRQMKRSVRAGAN